MYDILFCFFFFFQAEDGIRDATVTGVQTCALPIWERPATTPRWRSSRTGPNSGPRESGLANLVLVWIQESGTPAFEEVLQANEEFRPAPALSPDVLCVSLRESCQREIDRGAARFLLEVELDHETGSAPGPTERDVLVGLPLRHMDGPGIPAECIGPAGPRFQRCGAARQPARGPVVELGRIGERAEHRRRLRFDQDGQAQLGTGHRGMVWPHAVGPTLRDGLQVSQAHSPRVLDAPRRRVLERGSQMSHPKMSRVARCILKVV